MKRFVSLLLAVLMTAAVLTGCARQPQTPDRPQEEAVTIRVGGLKGPTSMGLVKLLDDAENQKTANAIDFQMAASANELTPLLHLGLVETLRRRGLAPLHAAVAERGGLATAFVGPSGSGKTCVWSRMASTCA